ncbi:MAG: glycosyltransferase family A protein [Saprospiraceae bacterium]
MQYKNPLVSIVVPSYNHAPFVADCIKSIVSQDFKDFELIVIDDGSKDESPSILKTLQQTYGFQLLLNKNQGLAKTLNQGFRDLAKGKYLTFCASDDYWLPGKLRKQVQFLEDNPEYAMVYGKAKIVDENNEEDVEQTRQKNEKLKGGFIFKELINIDFHPPVNYMLSALVIKELGYYKEHIWAEDFDMNLRIAESYPIGFIDEFLSGYRVNQSIPNKNLSFKTIYSHKNSIEQFSTSPFYKEAIKKWHFRCFTWYAPYIKGKKMALKGMFYNLDKVFMKEFLISFLVLLLKWHKE